MPMVSSNWELIFREILKAYNKASKDKIAALTPHICRHTACTFWYNQHVSLKAMQKLMGHSNVNVTMDVYTDCDQSVIAEEFKKFKGVS